MTQEEIEDEKYVMYLIQQTMDNSLETMIALG